MSKVLGTSIEQAGDNIFTAVIQFVDRNVSKDFSTQEKAQSWVESMTEHDADTNVEGSTINEPNEPDTFTESDNIDDSTASESLETESPVEATESTPNDLDNSESQA